MKGKRFKIRKNIYFRLTFFERLKSFKPLFSCCNELEIAK